MADVRSTVKVDAAKLRQHVTGPNGEPLRKIMRAQRRTLIAAKMRAPVDSGLLRQRHRTEPVTVTGNRITTAVVAATDYAADVHDGTRPHVIRPKSKKALSWKRGGVRVFAQSVNHPGAPPRPWLLNAAKEAASAEGFTVTPGR